MTLDRRTTAMLAALGSLGLLLGAFAFQYLGGLQPCTLCLWQRYPHGVAIGVGLIAYFWNPRAVLWLGALAALTSAAIAGFHVGVEQGWWQGLATCSAGSIEGISVEDLLNPSADVAAPVRCDAIAWSLLGISMAGWNGLASLGLATLWVMASRTRV
jgi:disulfide bond formation protein DsbB